MSLISFNSAKIQANGFNNILRHEFPNSSANFKDAEIALHSVSLYNSVFNIDGNVYGNNTLSIQMPTTSTTSTVTVTFPDGLYSYADMNRFIQAQLVAAGAYLVDASGNNVHYIQLAENTTYYSCQVDCSPVPITVPSNWTRPTTGLYSSSGAGLPSTTRAPVLTVSNAAFGLLIGFAAGSYPASPQVTFQTFLSNITPTVHPVTSYMLRCSLVKNDYNVPGDILATFDAQGSSVGQLISVKPTEYNWIPISDGSYASITLTLVDQSERFVRIRDPNLLISILVRPRR